MAISNRERVHQGIELLRQGLTPFVERMLNSQMGSSWAHQVDTSRKYGLKRNKDGSVAWDSQALLKTMWSFWNDAFREVLGQSERTYVSELIDVRNKWAHEDPFSSDDTHRALDSMKRLLEAVSAKAEAEEVDKSRVELMRTVYSEQARKQTRRKVLTLEGTPKEGLKPWREIVTPHPDVSSGNFRQSEFAADLAQVYRNSPETPAEYGDPTEFFSRTFLTEGLADLLKGAMKRLTNDGGDPVIELQTNFGGGKTHSMLALYHLFGPSAANTLPGVEPLMEDVGVKEIKQANRSVLVGTALSPGKAETKDDGTVINTLWGRMAWQLGGKEGFDMIAEMDANGTSPGSDEIKDLLDHFAPCLILIDEWVAFTRQLYHVDDLPAGSFDANISFVQSLTEAAKAADRALVVASLPQSNIEIGGDGGKAALDRLHTTFSRVESSWKPASPDEGFEIVRRRLFQPITEQHGFASRDAVLRSYSRLYQDEASEFPQECGEASYRSRLEKAYPIHPELFDRLHNDWGALDKFQKTRGVLRLMASVIHALWTQEDRSLMIMPASIPIDVGPVQSELTRYMSDPWDAILASDVDGETSLPYSIDNEVPNLGRYSATRRVARTIYVGSAPGYKGQNPGIDDRQIKLGSAQPGYPATIFGDALRRLTNKATFLHQDGSRYWYSTQPSLTRFADDRAAQCEEADVMAKIADLIRTETAGKTDRGEFAGVHAVPPSSSDVPDEPDVRLVILGPKHTHSAKVDGGDALETAKGFLSNRGGSPRIYRNMLVFLAPDKQRLEELDTAVRAKIAWASIVDDPEGLDLSASQVKQAKTKLAEMESTVAGRLKETWIWMLAPEQPDPRGETEWSPTRLQGQDGLVQRASKKLVQSEGLITKLGPGRLQMSLNNHLWGDDDHINTKKLWEYLASYIYLPRLRDSTVLSNAIQDGIGRLTCDFFGYADRYDERLKRYIGLISVGGGSVVIDGDSVVIKPEVAVAQPDPEKPDTPPIGPGGDDTGGGGIDHPTPDPDEKLPVRFYGSVELDSDRIGRNAGRIAEEVIQHLSTLSGAKVTVTMEIEVEVPEGVPEDDCRVVSENAQTLNFKTHGFEKD